MNPLSHLRLRTKLSLLLGLFAVSLVISLGAGATLMRQRMIDDRVDKLRAIVQSSIGVAKLLNVDVEAGRLSQARALERLGDTIHGMRFDSGEGYIIVRRDAVILLHGVNPGLEGKPSSTTDATGRPLTDLINNALRTADDGVVSYLFPKPGEPEPRLKISYVARYAPWQVVIFAGAYTDDLEASLHATLWRLGAIGGAVLLITLCVTLLINRDIGGSLSKLKSAMERLATGDLTTEIGGTNRRDEVGAMAGAVLVFKDHMRKVLELAEEQERERQRADAEKRAALVGMADRIEAETATALREVGARTTAMTATAAEMSASAARTGKSAESAAAASAQALANAQTVASAAEQLSASIREIGVQVTQSTEVVARAVAAGTETRTTMDVLNEQVGRIGAVADMIGEIAARTNLLALNATIEAARAGDAGKGFAVVASEVKALAAQTARSTREIAEHLGEVRAATGASVAAVSRIEMTIDEIRAIAGSIAAAVEQQGAATAEIARNVTETASAANEMTRRTTEVSDEARLTGGRANEVSENAAALNDAVGELRHSVIRVVRTSSVEVDRRGSERVDVDLPCRVTVGGQVYSGRIVDLSDGGGRVLGVPPLHSATRGMLHVDGLGAGLDFEVVSGNAGTLHVAFNLVPATAASFRAARERFARRHAA